MASKAEALGYVQEAERGIRQRDTARALAACAKAKETIKGLREPAPPPVDPPPSPEGKVLFASDFASFDGFYVQSIKGRATTANGLARFEVRPGDVEPDTGSQRSEVSLSNPTFKTGDEIWVRDRFRWAPDDSASPSWETTHQWHDGGPTGGNYSPAVGLFRYGNTIKLVNGKGTKTYWTGPSVQRGAWCELVYRVLFDPSDGELEVYWNGQHVADFQGLTTNTGIAYWKGGIYRAKETKTGISVVERDKFVIATTKAAALA